MTPPPADPHMDARTDARIDAGTESSSDVVRGAVSPADALRPADSPSSDALSSDALSSDALSSGDTWVELTHDELPIAALYAWALDPAAGAVVLFSGTVRDHAEHRTGVTQLVYEAYEAEVAPRLSEIAAELRRRWPSVCKAALLHRVGTLGLTESSVVVAVSAPHRDAAFEAARFGIDTLKATVPIWKQEHHDGGTDWGLQSQPIAEVPRAETSRADLPGAGVLGADVPRAEVPHP